MPPNEDDLQLVRSGDGRRTAHEVVRETLRRAILRGELPGGSRLIQADLAARLDVSTTPVREALRDLATEGLITLDRHRGGIVRQLDWDEMQEIVMIRRAVEPLAIRLAFVQITDEEIARAEALHEQMRAETDLAAWVGLNRMFHHVFHNAARSPRLASMLVVLQDAGATYVAQAQRWQPDIRHRADGDHAALLQACRRRDVAAAIASQHEHVAVPIDHTDPARRAAGSASDEPPVAAHGS
jgi:DNA-binding GntR family transcriptional regulator